MARIILDINKSIEQNASLYYDHAKRIKKKIEGARKALEETQNKLERLEKQKSREELREEKGKEHITPTGAKREWYEKFRWFVSSEGFLAVGGRDAATNEIVVKKHTEKDDLVFHTDMIGSPFFVIKSENKPIGEKTKKEAADATITFSRAWKLSLNTSSVFYCAPEQLTKEAPSGEFVPRGGFITKGKLTYIENKVSCAIGIYNDKVMAGPLEAIKKNCEKYVEIEQGRQKASEAAKYIQKLIGGRIDEIIRALPSGGFRIKK